MNDEDVKVTDNEKEPIESVEKTVEELKRKIQEITIDEKEEDKDSFFNAEKLEELKESTKSTLESSINTIKNTAAKASENPDVQKTVNYIKENAMRVAGFAKDKLDEVSKNEKVQDAVQKAEKYVNENIAPSAKDGWENLSKSVNQGTKNLVDGVNEYVNRPDVQEKIEKVKASASDAASKGTDAIKNFFKKNQD